MPMAQPLMVSSIPDQHPQPNHPHTSTAIMTRDPGQLGKKENIHCTCGDWSVFRQPYVPTPICSDTDSSDNPSSDSPSSGPNFIDKSTNKLCLPEKGYQPKYHVTCTIFDWCPAKFVLSSKLLSNLTSLLKGHSNFLHS